ncbi:hypothetical protein PFISCL1PPCAC_24922, partial [Pristionchus fissidentatus]
AKWDNRFQQLKRSYDPVRESFDTLFFAPLNDYNEEQRALSIVRREAHLEALELSLSTLRNLMDDEWNQVETWKEQQPGALFLVDVGVVLSSILECISSAGREILATKYELERNRDNSAGLRNSWELSHLNSRMRELTETIDKIPTVYELNRKYATTTVRTETTF